MARPKRGGAPPGRGRLQAWARGEPDATPRLDGRALAAGLEDVLQAFGRSGGRVLCVLWTYEPPDPEVQELAGEVLTETAKACAAAADEGGLSRRPSLRMLPFLFALASVMASQAEHLADGLDPETRAN